MTEKVNFAFVHGGGQGGWVWDETIAAMRAQDDEGALGALLPLDAPGCGSKRDRAAEHMSIRDIAAEMVAEIERAGLKKVVLVGHSQAGQPLPFMARLRPDLFRRLIYVSCSAPVPGQNVNQMIGNSVRGTNADEVGWAVDPATNDMTARFRVMFCHDMTELQASSFLAKLGQDMWPLETYTESDWSYDDFGGVPATYIACLQDQALPIEWQLKFADRFKAERLIHIDAGHQVMNSRPHALAEALRVDAFA